MNAPAAAIADSTTVTNINNEASQKTCFIITPIGADTSQTRRDTEGLIEAAIKPVLEKMGFKIIAPHAMSSSGSIMNAVIRHIVDSDLVIANLSTLNPNVIYEFAIRHAKMKPMVSIVDKSTTIPFDLKDDRMLEFEGDVLGVQRLKDALPAFVDEAMSEQTPNNPITRALGAMRLIESINNSDNAKMVKSFQISLTNCLTN